MKVRYALKRNVFFILFSLLVLFPISNVYAEEENVSACPPPDTSILGRFAYSPTACLSERVKESIPDLDIRRVIQDGFNEMITGVPSHLIYGRSMDQVHYCVTTILSTPEGKTEPVSWELAERAKAFWEKFIATLKNQDCSDLTYSPILKIAGIDVPPPTSSRTGGSLAGLTSNMLDASYNSPPPVNLAFYVGRVASKIPIINNTAFANPVLVDYHPMLLAVFNIWTFSRDVAFGLMAVFMLVIGIMIMMRKQLDSRTAVTVQNALPRIVIAVVLITFSYAIGSFAVALIGPLSKISVIFFLNNWVNAFNYGLPFMVAAMMTNMLGHVGTMGVGVFLNMIVGTVLIIQILWILFQVMIATFKIMVQIITGPIIFAWGAIPGNEKATTDWFKQLALNIIIAPLMLFFLAVASVFAFELSISPLKQIMSGEGVGRIPHVVIGTLSMMTMAIMTPLLIMFILFYAGKLPKKLKEVMLGPPKPKK